LGPDERGFIRLGPGECRAGERGTGLTVPFSNFLDPTLARTGPLAGPGLPRGGPRRVRGTGLHGVDLLARIFLNLECYHMIGSVDPTLFISPPILFYEY
jgi:hypothetical protein